jgi:single-strand DNA-binding protein
MLGYLNKVCLIGNVGKILEINHLPNTHKEVATFTLATSTTWRNKTNGEYKSKTEWHTIVVWNEFLINIVKKSLNKGTRVYVEGNLCYKKWEDKDGHEKINAEIVLQAFSGDLIILESKVNNSAEQNEKTETLKQEEALNQDIPF